MKFPVTETWANAYTLSGLTPGSELAIKPSGAAEIVVIEGDIDLPVQARHNEYPFNNML